MKQQTNSTLGFADLVAGQRKVKAEFFNQINRVIDWAPVRRIIETVYTKGRGPLGRPGYAGAVLFRIELLCGWYELSDWEVEEQVNDRISFNQFAGLSLEDAVPGSTTVCRFRNQLVEVGLYDRLLDEINRQLADRGVLVMRGAIVDASVPPPPAARAGGRCTGWWRIAGRRRGYPGRRRMGRAQPGSWSCPGPGWTGRPAGCGRRAGCTSATSATPSPTRRAWCWRTRATTLPRTGGAARAQAEGPHHAQGRAGLRAHRARARGEPGHIPGALPGGAYLRVDAPLVRRRRRPLRGAAEDARPAHHGVHRLQPVPRPRHNCVQWYRIAGEKEQNMPRERRGSVKINAFSQILREKKLVLRLQGR